jgi:hypothetical protein
MGKSAGGSEGVVAAWDLQLHWHVTREILVGAAVIALTGAAWSLSPAWGAGPQLTNAAATASADALQQELLRKNLDRPADPALANRFAEINKKHFFNSLPAIPVVWEPRLADVGTLAGRTFTLLGMFGRSGDRAIILLHPDLQNDAAGLDRALCHEMIHAYLFSVGDTSTDHGQAFRNVLHRLLNEGAFVSIEASPEERATLRTWLEAESVRLSLERSALEGLAAEIGEERAALDRAVESLNVRGSAANGSGGPSPEEVAAVKAQRDRYIERIASMNRRAVDFHSAQDEYNAQAARYNLMATYPDGLDEPVGANKK